MENQLIETTIAELRRHNFEAIYIPTGVDAKAKILEMIPLDAKVGAAGSMTTRDMGIVSALIERGNTVFENGNRSISPEDRRQAMIDQLTCDVFLTGSNAVTADGEIVNMDNVGNRIAALSFGPKRVIIVVGKNKIVKNIDAGLERIRAVAGPLDAKRLGKNTPCVEKGHCQNCASPQRICNATLILRRSPRANVTVVIVGEDWGF